MSQTSIKRDLVALQFIIERSYSVTTDGKVFSENYGGKSGVRKELVSRDDRYGYLRVYLSLNGKRMEYAVHRLVLLSCVGIDKKRRLVNHKNGNKHDNIIENLEWVTPAKNLSHAFKTGLMRQVRGEDNARSILKEAQVREILRMLQLKKTRKEIAHLFGVGVCTIHEIANGKSWKHIKRGDSPDG